MHETPGDLAALQALLDRSYAGAGPHLAGIHTGGRRLPAAEVAARLRDMCLLVLATSTADGRPLTGPVDGVFHRGAFHFGTGTSAVRARHLAVRPAVSATHLPSEDWSVTVHGRAVPVDLADPAHADVRATFLAVYTPRYGPEWESFLDSGVLHYRIEADRMFALDVTAADSASSEEFGPPADG